MDNAFPSWILPLWIIGVPLILIIIDYVRAPTTVYTSHNRPMSFRRAPSNLA
jgi:hypothetical protein